MSDIMEYQMSELGDVVYDDKYEERREHTMNYLRKFHSLFEKKGDVYFHDIVRFLSNKKPRLTLWVEGNVAMFIERDSVYSYEDKVQLEWKIFKDNGELTSQKDQDDWCDIETGFIGEFVRKYYK